MQKWPGNPKFLFRVFRLFEKNRFRLRVASFLNFRRLKRLRLASFLSFRRQKRLSVASFLNLGNQNRLSVASFLSFRNQKRLRVASFLRSWAPDCRIRGIPHDDDDSPGNPNPPPHHAQEQKYVVRPGSSLRYIRPHHLCKVSPFIQRPTLSYKAPHFIMITFTKTHPYIQRPALHEHLLVHPQASEAA